MTKLWYELPEQLKPLYDHYAFLQFVEEQLQNDVTPKTKSFGSEVCLRQILAIGGLSVGVPYLGKGDSYIINSQLNSDQTRTVFVAISEDGVTRTRELDEKTLLSYDFRQHLSIWTQRILNTLYPGHIENTIERDSGMWLSEVRPYNNIGEGLIMPVGTSTSSDAIVAGCLAWTRMAIQMHEAFRHVNARNIFGHDKVRAHRVVEAIAKANRSMIVETYKPRVTVKANNKRPTATMSEFKEVLLSAFDDATISRLYQDYLKAVKSSQPLPNDILSRVMPDAIR